MFRVMLMKPSRVPERVDLAFGESLLPSPLRKLVMTPSVPTRIQQLTEVTEKPDQLSGWYIVLELLIHLPDGLV